MSLRDKLPLVAAIAAALAARLCHLEHVFTEQGLMLLDPDSCYHLLLVKRILEHFPLMPFWDTGLAHPYGAEIPWPPLFDFFTALAARPAYQLLGPPAGEAAATLVNPLLAALSLILLYSLLQKWQRPLMTWVGLFLFALLPKAVEPTRLGVMDHHGAEVLLSLAVALTFLQTLESGRRLSLALACAGLLLTWAGGAIHILPVCLSGLWLYLGQGQPANVSRVGQALVLAAVFYLLALATLRPGGLLCVSFIYPSLFQGYELLTMGAALCLLRGQRSKPAELTRAALAGIILVLVLPGFLPSLIEGLRFFAKHNPWLSSIAEYQPLFFSRRRPLRREALNLLSGTGLTMLLLPLALARWIKESLPPGRDRHQAEPTLRVTAVCFSAVFLLYSLNQLRYLWHLMPWLALAGGWAIDLLAGRLGGVRRVAAAVLLVGMMLGPSALVIYGYPWYQESPEMRAVIEAGIWLKGYARGHTGKSPAGVMVPWHWGHVIHLYSGLPVVADGFGDTLAGTGLYDSLRFYLSTSDEEAQEVLAQRQVRFVLAVHPLVVLWNGLEILDQKGPPYLARAAAPGDAGELEPLPAYYQTMAVRLYFQGAGEGIRSLEHPGFSVPSSLRLVYPAPECAVREKGREAVLVYEYLPGEE